MTGVAARASAIATVNFIRVSNLVGHADPQMTFNPAVDLVGPNVETVYGTVRFATVDPGRTRVWRVTGTAIVLTGLAQPIHRNRRTDMRHLANGRQSARSRRSLAPVRLTDRLGPATMDRLNRPPPTGSARST